MLCGSAWLLFAADTANDNFEAIAGSADGRSSGASDKAARRTVFDFFRFDVEGRTTTVDSTLEVTDRWLSIRNSVFIPLVTSFAVGTELKIVRMAGIFLTSRIDMHAASYVLVRLINPKSNHLSYL
jgi:hypothetical protein